MVNEHLNQLIIVIVCIIYSCFIGLEAFYQVAGQIILLLFATTETRTTGGLEAVFNQQNGFLGIQNPIAVLAVSISITL